MLGRRIFNGKDLNNIVDTYSDIILEYVNTGLFPNNFEKSTLLETLKSSTIEQKKFLRDVIKDQLPQCSWAYTGAWCENLPTAAKWGTIGGIGAGVAQYQISENVYSATASGIAAGVATFFAHSKYKQRQFEAMMQAKEERAKEFLTCLAPPKEPCYTPNKLNSKKR
jgi:hypothetical protein